MDTLVHTHQQINPFLYQKSPQDFHTYLNLPQEDFIRFYTTGSWSFPGKAAFLFHSPPAFPQACIYSCGQHFLRSCPGTFGCVIGRRGSVSSVCLEVAVWTCGAPAEPGVQLPVPARSAGSHQLHSGAGGSRW